MPTVLKSGSLKFLEPSGPVQACNGTALPLPLPTNFRLHKHVRHERKYYTGINPLTPNDPYRGRTAPLTSKRCILYIYSTNIGTEYFKHGIYSPFFFSSKCSLFHNFKVFGSCIIHILYTGVPKLKKITAPKG